MKLVVAYVLTVPVVVLVLGSTSLALSAGGVIVMVGGLIYFPVLILGPVGERIVG